MAESLVYCFESSGDVNIESTAELGILFNSESAVHEDDSHEHGRESVYHQEIDHHRDIPVSLLCASEDKLNRLDQQKTVSDLKRAVYQRIEVASSSRSKQQTIFLPPIIENPATTNLKTVVLLN